MDELKTLEIELIKLEKKRNLILIEYLNEKNEPCMRFDKIIVQKDKAQETLKRLIERFDKEFPKININTKITI